MKSLGLLGVVCSITYGVAGKGNHPINCVSFKQALSYCSYRGKRLIDEGEWDWAARAGARGWRWPFSNDWEVTSRHACLSPPSRPESTCAVGTMTLGSSPEGVHDLLGNVWEWGADDGGSFLDDNTDLKRGRALPTQKRENHDVRMGIRCAKTPGVAAPSAY